MNGEFQTSRDEIGIDPTTIEVIDSLDFDGSDSSNSGPTKNNNKKEKAKTLFSKVIFAFGILLLMGLVAFGIYFYLNLGKKTVNKPRFVLDDKEVYIGTELSQNILDYGTFTSEDIAGCSLDTSKVNTDKTGAYEYSMTCNGSKYTASITVIDKYDFEVTANIVYKTSSDVIIESEFFNSEYEYIYTKKDNNVDNYLFQPGGPYYVEFSVTEEKENKKGTISSILYVTEAKARTFLTCTSPIVETDDISKPNYKIVNVFAFDNFKNYLKVPSRYYLFEGLTTQQYVELLNGIENGKITISDKTGYALRDDENLRIRIVDNFSNEEFNDEAGEELKTYNEIKEYYESKKYSCE